MRIAVVFNPISGAGRAAAAAERAAGLLARAGHDVVTLTTQLAPTVEWLDPSLRSAELLIVAGGDGAVRLAAPAACRTGAAIYHLPFGTENLFAREFGMNASIDALLRAIDHARVRTVDVALANGRWFLLMASVGFDAEVVHELAGTRGGSISHWSYIKPIIRTIRNWSPPVLRVDVDGQALVDGDRGIVVIANSRQYGWRIDPAARAEMADGLLDVVFLPATSLRQVVMWVLRCRTRRQFQHRSLRFARGSAVRVRSEHPQHFQLDGDPPGVVKELLPEGFEAAGHAITEDETGSHLDLRVNICPGRLRVLSPR